MRSMKSLESMTSLTSLEVMTLEITVCDVISNKFSIPSNHLNDKHAMAVQLSIQKRFKIAARYEVWGSVIRVQRWFKSTFGRHETLNKDTIKRCHDKLAQTGSVNNKKRPKDLSKKRTVENVAVVRRLFTDDPERSIRNASLTSGLSYTLVRDILHKDLNFKPWKPHYVQELFPEDMDRRLEYAENMLEMSERRPDVFSKIIWSDEAVFHVGGFVNRHNSHYWAGKSPKKLIKKSQHRPRLTVWAAITADALIGPVILRDTMNAERYLEVLEGTLVPSLHAIDRDQDMIFMQDGAPPHYATAVRQFLNDELSGRWLGRRGPHEWPARSCDITPCDFFLWGWAKQEVYQRSPSNLEELEFAIRDVLANVPAEFLRKAVLEEVPDRLRKLTERNGGYVEI